MTSLSVTSKLWSLLLAIAALLVVVVVLDSVLVYRSHTAGVTTTVTLVVTTAAAPEVTTTATPEVTTTATPEVTTTVAPNPEVTITQGLLRGTNLVSRNDRQIYAFQGIPYAQPPVGDLRFAAPVAAGPWDGTLDASSDTEQCTQQSGGVEDCLYLNVYTPQLPTGGNSELLPVLMFIHGGGFTVGSNIVSRTGPGHLLEKDVVLVVPNYRLGMLGFFSTGDEVVPGNNGLKDLVKALEWNRDNIQHFGGDPNRTTIFGQSSGGMTTQLLALSNLTDGLFHNYISESGSALCYDAHRPRTVLAQRAITAAEYLNCPTNTSTEIVDCFRGLNTSELLSTDSLFSMVSWSPTNEPDVEGACLTEDPRTLLEAGRFRPLPWLSTVNLNESVNQALAIGSSDDAIYTWLENLETRLSTFLTIDTKVENVTAYTDALRSFYLNDWTVDTDTLLRNISQLLGDALFVYPSYNANRLLLANGAQPQYFGSFEFRGNSYNSRYDGDVEVAHGDELIYLFPSVRTSLMNATDWEMVDTLVDLWTSFAANGTPSTVWDQFTSVDNYLRIGGPFDTSLEVQYNFFENRMQFWDELTAATTWL